MNPKTLIKASGVHKTFIMGRSEVKVLRGVSMSVSEGEFLVIMGSSGSGKSTLLHILGALDIPDKGVVEFRGENLFDRPDRYRQKYRNKKVGFVFQFYHLLPELNVLENVLMARMIGYSVFGWWSARHQAKKEAMDMLEHVGLSDRLKHRPNELSGGERQRVTIARALINNPSLLLADEPTGNLDTEIGDGILNLLTRLNRAGQTIVMVTHDEKVASLAHRRLMLSEGVLREISNDSGQGPSAQPTKEVVREHCDS